MFYNLSKEDFSKILRQFRASGTPKTCRLTNIGHLLHCINDDAREIYQIIYMPHDSKAFVVEYSFKFEQIQVVTGDIASFNELFNVNAIKS
jgi:hypothetical protein